MDIIIQRFGVRPYQYQNETEIDVSHRNCFVLTIFSEDFSDFSFFVIDRKQLGTKIL